MASRKRIECAWCGKKSARKFCSAKCLKEAFDMRDVMQQSGDCTLDDAIELHNKHKVKNEEPHKRLKFVHYTSGAGRWEYVR